MQSLSALPSGGDHWGWHLVLAGRYKNEEYNTNSSVIGWKLDRAACVKKQNAPLMRRCPELWELNVINREEEKHKQATYKGVDLEVYSMQMKPTTASHPDDSVRRAQNLDWWGRVQSWELVEYEWWADIFDDEFLGWYQITAQQRNHPGSVNCRIDKRLV